jgi:glycine oxidase
MLTVAGDRDAAEALERAVAFRRSLGLEIELMRPSEARSLEPALAPRVRLAALSPIEQSVDPVWLIDALAEAARRAGAVLREGVTVAGLAESSGRVRGVRLADGEVWSGGSVVVAAGAWSGRLGTLPVRPVKGQIMRLSDPAGPGLVSRPVRFEDGYLVPRGDGRYVLGATVEERGFDATVTSGAIYELLRDAAEVVPGVLELELEDVRAGLRPGMPDNIPAIGPAPTPGLLWATGHFRNGILLTPLTAELVVGALAGESEPPLAELCSPRRFYGAEVVA